MNNIATAQQAVARFQQTEQQLKDQYRAQYNDIPAEYYDELLDQPLKQFCQDLLAAGLEPGDYEWALAAHQTGLTEFVGNGWSGEYVAEQRDLARHRRWLATPQGLAAVIKYPDLAEFTVGFDPDENYLDPAGDYAQERAYWQSLTPQDKINAVLAKLKKTT